MALYCSPSVGIQMFTVVRFTRNRVVFSAKITARPGASLSECGC